MPSSDANERLAAIGEKVYDDETTEMVELLYRHCCNRGGDSALRGLLQAHPDLVHRRLRGGRDTALTAAVKILPTFRALRIVDVFMASNVDLSRQVDVKGGGHVCELLFLLAAASCNCRKTVPRDHESEGRAWRVSAEDWRDMANIPLEIWGEQYKDRVAEVKKKAQARIKDAEVADEMWHTHAKVEQALRRKRSVVACNTLLAASATFPEESFSDAPGRTLRLLIDHWEWASVEAMAKVRVFDYSFQFDDGHNVASKLVATACKALPRCGDDNARESIMKYYYSSMDELRCSHPDIMKDVLRLLCVEWLNGEYEIPSAILRSLAKFKKSDVAVNHTAMTDLLATTPETSLVTDVANVSEFMKNVILHANAVGGNELEQFTCRSLYVQKVSHHDAGIAFKVILLFVAVLGEDPEYAQQALGNYLRAHMGDSYVAFDDDDSDIVGRLEKIEDPDLLMAAVSTELLPGGKRLMWKLSEAASRNVPFAEDVLSHVLEICPKACCLMNRDDTRCIEPLSPSFVTGTRSAKDGSSAHRFVWAHGGHPELLGELLRTLVSPKMIEVAERGLQCDDWMSYAVDLAKWLEDTAVFENFLYARVGTQWLPMKRNDGQFCRGGDRMHTGITRLSQMLVNSCLEAISSLDARQIGHLVKEMRPFFMATPVNGESVYVTLLRKMIMDDGDSWRSFLEFEALMEHAAPRACGELVAANLDEDIVSMQDQLRAAALLRRLYKAYSQAQIDAAAATRLSQDGEARQYNIRSFAEGQRAGEGVMRVLDDVFGSPEASGSSEPPNKKRRF